MQNIGKPIYSLDQMAGEYLARNSKKTEVKPSMSFDDVLQKTREIQSTGESGNVIFSKHANERMNSRNIQLSNAQIERLNQGVEQAREKHIQASLVMMDDLTFIVNVKNNTVVTAIDQQSASSQVFTNIDGAVII